MFNLDGVTLGFLGSYSQDLIFTMKRLSNNSFILQRLHADEMLPYEVNDKEVGELTSPSLAELQRQENSS